MNHYQEICDSKESQSPINIVDKDVMLEAVPSVIALYTDYIDGLVENKLGKISFTVDSPSKFTVHQIPMRTKTQVFNLDRVDFHWGNDDQKGSEHSIDDQFFPLEAQFIFFDRKYNSLDKAKNHYSAIVAFSVLFNIGAENKLINQLLFNGIDSNTFYNGSNFSVSVELDKLLPSNYDSRFYFYNGSLTGPGCEQDVAWLIFENHLTISTEQMSKFRLFKQNSSISSVLSPNYRSTRPLGERTVFISWLEHSGQGPTGNTYILALFFILSSIFITVGF
jgi:carbonic anhydrase